MQVIAVVRNKAHPPRTSQAVTCVLLSEQGAYYFCYAGQFSSWRGRVAERYIVVAQLSPQVMSYGAYSGNWLRKVESFTACGSQPLLPGQKTATGEVVKTRPEDVPTVELPPSVTDKVAVESRCGLLFVNYSDAKTTTAETVGWANERVRLHWEAMFGCAEGEHLAGLEFGPKGITAHRSFKEKVVPT